MTNSRNFIVTAVNCYSITAPCSQFSNMKVGHSIIKCHLKLLHYVINFDFVSL
jgi:hypothetical protein